MHRFLKAAGFAELDELRAHRLIWDEVVRPEHVSARLDLEDEAFLLEYRLPVNEYVGVAAAVLYARDYQELRYYYPYFTSFELTSPEPFTLEPHTMSDNYSGVLDDMNTGISLIFFVNNPVLYRQRPDACESPLLRGVALSAFANEGIVILPVTRNEEELMGSGSGPDAFMSRSVGGQDGDIDIITAQEIEHYRRIADRMESEDLYSVVEQSLIPYGVECDLYQVIGEILAVEQNTNLLTGERLWLLKVSCNDVVFWLCMRQADLTGEPEEGRRIKCRLWMQGNVNTYTSGL